MNKVLACIDGGPHTTGVCDYAIWAAQRLQAPLEFLHVLERQPDRALIHDLSGSVGLGAQETLLAELTQLDEQHNKVAQEHGRQILEAAQQRAAEAGVAHPGARQRHGMLTDTLLALQTETRLVVMGQHPQAGAVPRLHLDQNVERAVRTLQKPVLVATNNFCLPRHFAIAFDGSPTGCKLVEALAASPLLRDRPCHLVTASSSTTSAPPSQLEWARNKLIEAGFVVQTTHHAGEAETVLQDTIVAHSIDLLVMGAYGHSRIRELIVGSTTTTMLRTSPVPVLILR